MSKVLIGYNIDEITKKQKDKIIHSLFEGFADDLFFSSKICFEKFGKVQVLFSSFSQTKTSFLIKGDVLINICGFIENQKEICENNNKEDIETCIIDKYLEGGCSNLEGLFAKFSGHFAVFIYNKENDEILLVSDKLGTYTAYTYSKNDRFIYSTEVEALLCFKEVPKNLNFKAIADFLSIGIVQERESFIDNVNNLDSATILQRSVNGKINKSRYFNFVYNDPDFSLDKSLIQVNDKLKKAIIRKFDASVGDNCSEMTGGFDTRLINSILVDNNRNCPIVSRMFSVSKLFSGDDNLSDYDKFALEYDRKISMSFARKFGVDYYTEEENKDELNKINNTFCGFMGGEILGGHMWHNLITENIKNIFDDKFIMMIGEYPIDRYHKNVDRIDCQEKDKKRFIYKIELYLSTFYNYSYKISSPWYRPRRFSNPKGNAFYPFLDFDFLEELFKVPFAVIDDYGFYIPLLDKFYSEYCKIDIFSNMRYLYKYDESRTPRIYESGNINKESTVVKRDAVIKEPVNELVKPKKVRDRDLLESFNQFVGMDVLSLEVKTDYLLRRRIGMVLEWLEDNGIKRVA